MIWSSWDAFWKMGGYGLYVWGSYGVFFAIVVLECWQLRSRRHAALQEAGRAAARSESVTGRKA